MSRGWQLLVDRRAAARTTLRDWEVPEVGDGQVLLRSSLTAITANSIAYAELGEQLRYSEFFPVEDEVWSTPPMWGFADVEKSNVEQIEPGTRVYGFIPSASHAIATPQMVGEGRFRDVGGVRPELPPSYSNYLITTRDPSYVPADREDFQVVFRPLFITSWALADFLVDNDFYRADTIVVSSASSKTAYGAALSLAMRKAAPQLIGLTSEGNRDFVESLGCYSRVMTYDDFTGADVPGTVVYVDLAGSSKLRGRVGDELGERLVRHVVVGLTHHEGVLDNNTVGGPQPEFWFCPDHLKKRGAEWGPGVLHSKFSADYQEAIVTLAQWANFVECDGPEELRNTWRAVIDGKIASGSANVVRLS